MSVWFLYAPGRAERRSCERCLFERRFFYVRLFKIVSERYFGYVFSSRGPVELSHVPHGRHTTEYHASPYCLATLDSVRNAFRETRSKPRKHAGSTTHAAHAIAPAVRTVPGDSNFELSSPPWRCWLARVQVRGSSPPGRVGRRIPWSTMAFARSAVKAAGLRSSTSASL